MGNPIGAVPFWPPPGRGVQYSRKTMGIRPFPAVARGENRLTNEDSLRFFMVLPPCRARIKKFSEKWANPLDISREFGIIIVVPVGNTK